VGAFSREETVRPSPEWSAILGNFTKIQKGRPKGVALLYFRDLSAAGVIGTSNPSERSEAVRRDDSRSESYKEEDRMSDFLIELLFSGLKKVSPITPAISKTN
jgi:hypothetical protein